MKIKFIYITLLSIFLVACSGNSKEEANQMSNSETSSESITETVAESDTKSQEKTSNEKVIELGKPISYDTFDITIKEFSIVKDYENNDVLKFVYDFTNKSDDPVMPFIAFNIKGFQDGIETDSAGLFLEGVDLEPGQKEIKKDATITDAEGVIGITDITKPLELELSEFFSFSNEKYTITLDLSAIE